ncbi:hypothetical protein E2542_SST23125 [Spatholobus suberectus]|nr:hypothetical protein E2542_SST23125 [Spatholobus suberectus]
MSLVRVEVPNVNGANPGRGFRFKRRRENEDSFLCRFSQSWGEGGVDVTPTSDAADACSGDARNLCKRVNQQRKALNRARRRRYCDG